MKLFILGCVVSLIGLAFNPGSASAYTISATDDVMVGRYKYWPQDYTYYDSELYWEMSTGYYHNASASSYSYNSYIQFDLSSVPDDYSLSSAVLSLYVFNGTVESPYVSHISDDSWDESTINWFNRPASDGLIANQVNWGFSPSNEWIDIPLASWDYQADLSDNVLSIVLTPDISGNIMTYATRDYSGGEFAATLELTGDSGVPIPEPTTVALLGIGLAGLAGGVVRRRFKKAKQQ